MREIVDHMEDRNRDALGPVCPECGKRSQLKTWRNKPGQPGTVYVCAKCAQQQQEVK
jgi:Zn ribbon nucleic-acid-binding protein